DVDKAIATHGQEIVDGLTTHTDATGKVVSLIFADFVTFAMELVARWASAKLRIWVEGNAKASTLPGANAQLPFPHLLPELEVIPSRPKVPQGKMTKSDWKKCVAIYDNRWEQAGISRNQVREAFDLIEPLLDDEDRLTTADVIGNVD